MHGEVGIKKLVNLSLSARDLQFFSRDFPTSRVGYYAGKPIGSAVYCLKKLVGLDLHLRDAEKIFNY